MSSKFTRRRFLRVLGAGTACLTLTGAEGCEVLGRDTKLKSLHTPRVSPLRVPKVRLLPSVSPAPLNGVVLPLTSRTNAAPDKWVVNDYPAHYETTNLRASFE